MEALGFTPSASPVRSNHTNDSSDSHDSNNENEKEDFGIDAVDDGLSKLDVSSEDMQVSSTTKEGAEGGSRRGSGKRYSLKCVNMVQKKIRDFVQTDEVMEDL